MVVLVLLIIATETAMSSECSEFEWSNNPGAYESHLARRCGNPYFPSQLQVVSEEELFNARMVDNADYHLAEERFARLGEEFEALPLTVTIDDFHKVRERLDDLIFFSMGVGGHAYEFATKADQIRDALISDMRTAFSNDEEALESIEKADKFHKQKVRKFYIPVMAQMLRERSPIRGEDTIAAILSEDAQTIALVMSVFDEQTRLLVQREALRLLKEALDQGYIDPGLEEKISALGG